MLVFMISSLSGKLLSKAVSSETQDQMSIRLSVMRCDISTYNVWHLRVYIL